jgi:hypothetical protein
MDIACEAKIRGIEDLDVSVRERNERRHILDILQKLRDLEYCFGVD